MVGTQSERKNLLFWKSFFSYSFLPWFTRACCLSSRSMLAMFLAAVIKCMPLMVALARAIGNEMYNSHLNRPFLVVNFEFKVKFIY